ncbi:unnamed protein product [Umbelopsis vinacea]
MTSEDAIKYHIPNREFINIEYPGRVNNYQKAFNNLGGVPALEKENPEVELKFRANYPLSHGIPGNVVNTKNLLLKVTRKVKKSNPDEQVGAYEAEMVGHIGKTCRFRAMADFQFIVPPENRIAKIKKAVVECDVDQMMKFKLAEDDYDNLELIPPPLFTRQEMPFDYRYKQRQIKPYCVTWEDKAIPQKPQGNIRIFENEPAEALKLVKEELARVLNMASSALRGASNLDQVCYKRQTKAVASPVSANTHFSVMPALSYNALSGPWRDTWIKYGYDPKIHPDAYQYQVLDVRRIYVGRTNKVMRGKRKPLESAETAATDSEPVDDSPPLNHRWDGTDIPESQNNYMLCDILLPEPKRIIDDPKYRKETCTKDSGFIYPTVFKDLRKIMKTIIAAVLNGEKMPTMNQMGVDVDASLRQDIAAETQASEGNRDAMMVDENATLEEAASAGPDVSARVDELMRNLQKAQDFEDEFELDDLEEYEDVFGEDEEEDEDNIMDHSDDNEEEIEELEDEE